MPAPNLISNAIQHGRPGTTIEVSVSGTATEVLFQVRNDADVIPPAKLRVASGMANLGLGLYVVKEIRAHDGSISVTSTPEEGVTFSVKLPRKTPKSPQQRRLASRGDQYAAHKYTNRVLLSFAARPAPS